MHYKGVPCYLEIERRHCWDRDGMELVAYVSVGREHSGPVVIGKTMADRTRRMAVVQPDGAWAELGRDIAYAFEVAHAAFVAWD